MLKIQMRFDTRNEAFFKVFSVLQNVHPHRYPRNIRMRFVVDELYYGVGLFVKLVVTVVPP